MFGGFVYTIFRFEYFSVLSVFVFMFLEHPQGVGIVGIVGTIGTVGIVGIEFCRPEPQPTTPSVLVDIPK